MASSASSLPGLPVASSTTVSGPMSTTSAWNTDATSRTCERVDGSVQTFTRASSRSTAPSSCSSTTLSTRTSLFSCSVTCPTGVDAPSTTIVIRLTRSSVVGPTASDEMLNARRANSPATCVKTPGLFSTSTESVWVLMAPSPFLRVAARCSSALLCWPGGRPPGTPAGIQHCGAHGAITSLRVAARCSSALLCWPGGARRFPGTPRTPMARNPRGNSALRCSRRHHLPAGRGPLLVCAEFRPEDDVVVGLAGRHHREDALPVVHPEVDHGGHIRHGQRLVQHRIHVARPVAAQPDAAVGLGELDIVGDLGAELDVGVPLVVEQLLPLAHHAEEAVVEDQDLDRQLLDRAGGEFLRGHLEAAIAVDRDHQLAGPANLGAHRGRDGESHRAEAAG